MDEYLPMFLAEGREHLQELNLAVVRIEETPGRPGDGRRDLPHRALHEGDERDDGLRRHGGAHPRDGGRLRAAAPARAAGSSAPRSTCSSSAWTRSSAAVEAIDETGAEAIQPQALIERLQQPRARAHAGAGGPARRRRDRLPDDLAELADGRRVVQVTAHLDEDVSMPSVRAYMVLSAIAELGETLACRPAPGRRRHASTAARSTRGSSPSAPTPSWPTPPPPSPRSPT